MILIFKFFLLLAKKFSAIDPTNSDSDEEKEKVGFGFKKHVKLNIDNSDEKTCEKDNFIKQMKEAADRARNIAEQLNAQIALYPEGYMPDDPRVSEDQKKQFKQQKEVAKNLLKKIIYY